MFIHLGAKKLDDGVHASRRGAGGHPPCSLAFSGVRVLHPKGRRTAVLRASERARVGILRWCVAIRVHCLGATSDHGLLPSPHIDRLPRRWVLRTSWTGCAKRSPLLSSQGILMQPWFVRHATMDCRSAGSLPDTHSRISLLFVPFEHGRRFQGTVAFLGAVPHPPRHSS